MKRILAFCIILVGLTAMASQIIYMRQLLIVFYGNELSISFILASWLIAGAVGSALLGRLSDLPLLRRDPILVFSSCQIILGILIPLGIVAIRLIKFTLHVNPGQILPMFPIMALSFLILAPICVTLGFMFSLGCSICNLPARAGHAGAGIAAGNVYILEAVGALIGGALTSVILIKLLDTLAITVVFAILNIIAAFFLLLYSGRSAPLKMRYGYLLATAAAALVIAITAAWITGGLERLDRYSLKRQWQGHDLVASKNSVYGNIAIVKKEEDFSFFENGLHLYTVPDKMRSEEATHTALLEHPDPKDILLIGGGVGGLVEEALKEPVKRIDYIEFDPLMIDMAEKYLPAGYYEALKNDKVSIKNIDGRFFVKTTKEKYDCIIINLGDPYTAGLNRYYTVEFFKEVKSILKDRGILSFALSSSESYISPPLGKFLSSIYFSLKEVFEDVLVMPGQNAIFLASKYKGYLTYDYKILEARTNERALNTKYTREYYLFSKLSPQNLSYINKIIQDKSGVRINRDFKPSSYYYGIIFWTTLFRDSAFGRIIGLINERIVWQMIGLLIILLTIIAAFLERSFRATTIAALAAGGFSTMAFQILILLSFQIIHGYLFYKLGIILTAFMAGLAIGAFVSIKIIEKIGKERKFLIAVQWVFFLYSLILPVFFLKSGADILFPAMSVIAGFIGGAQFPLANSVLLEKGGNVGRIGGLSYGVDLLGSFFGAFFTGALLAPILGILKTCVAIAIINLAVLGLLVLNLRVEE